ncbi:MAG: adenylate/guanylate cyclase domain-containing protein [Actinomycetota bacterium]|nr:adenylate/guanylate cyclase domain-containing protein [Actinomycetota bacterium]
MAIDPPTTRYARNGDIHLAYQVFGDGPIDLLYVPTWLQQMEVLWEEPAVAGFFERLTRFARVIMFDRRGSGMSDPLEGDPTLEEQMDDVLAVLDAAGSERPGLFAQFEGGPMALLFAATYPERTRALALYSAFASTLKSDELPWAFSADEREAMAHAQVERWGTGERLYAFAPSAAEDPAHLAWFAKLERAAMPPGMVARIFGLIGQWDVRAVLPTIKVPTVVIHRREDPGIDFRHAIYLSERIPGAKLVDLPPGDSLPLLTDSPLLGDELEEFFTGARPAREPDRVLATVMFTDIVESTARAADLGDARWRDLLERHDTLVRRHLARHRGREVKSTGDGFLATFDGPARAIRCACDITVDVRGLGLDVRAGLHTGELEVRGDDVAGMAVHIGARIGSLADGGEVLVSGTVKDLVVGSGIDFADRGEHPLKGVPGEWRVYSVES